jgi:hypothetical protein
VLPEAVADADLVADFRLTPGVLAISVSVPTGGPRTADPDSFAWQVLSTLTSSAGATGDETHFEVTFTTESSVPVAQPGAGG